MKLMRIGEPGRERPAILGPDGIARDLSALVPDWSGAHLDPARLAALTAVDLATLPGLKDGMRIGAPVAGIGKIIDVGLNYADHAAEGGPAIPKDPEGNFVELQCDSFGDWKQSSEWMRS